MDADNDIDIMIVTDANQIANNINYGDDHVQSLQMLINTLRTSGCTSCDTEQIMNQWMTIKILSRVQSSSSSLLLTVKITGNLRNINGMASTTLVRKEMIQLGCLTV
jgi:hypothetical protein